MFIHASILPMILLLGIAIGFVIGCAFTAAEFAKHRKKGGKRHD